MKKLKPPSAEEFEAWRENPVTQWVMDACLKAADDNQRLWFDMSWGQGKADQEALIELRTRADAYRAIAETEYDSWLAEHETEDK